MRKRHKGPEEDHDALGGAGKARGRNQPWDEHETSSDLMSQVGRPISPVCCWLGAQGLAGLPGLTPPLRVSWPCCTHTLGRHSTVESLWIKWNSNLGANAFVEGGCLSARATPPVLVIVQSRGGQRAGEVTQPQVELRLKARPLCVLRDPLLKRRGETASS